MSPPLFSSSLTCFLSSVFLYFCCPGADVQATAEAELAQARDQIEALTRANEALKRKQDTMRAKSEAEALAASRKPYGNVQSRVSVSEKRGGRHEAGGSVRRKKGPRPVRYRPFRN